MHATTTQHTIENAVSLHGIGLHTGKEVTMTVKPGKPGSGILFLRTDFDEPRSFKALVGNAEATSRGTNLLVDGERVYTVEHVLAACRAAGVDNVEIELDGPEPPAGDGSPRRFLDLLTEAGLKDQGKPRVTYRVKEPCSFSDDAGSIMVLPNRQCRLSYTLQYENPIIGYQHKDIVVDATTLRNELLPARTFCLRSEVDALQAHGQALGGSLDNAVVVGDDGVLNEDGLRFPDEFVRHKMADLVGDLALAGGYVHGHFVCIRSGHRHNVALVQALVKGNKLVREQEKPDYIDVQHIWEIIPHRFPFLLVDRIVEMEVGKRAVGLKNVSINEPFFQGHFPGQPVMPGVLMVEALAQVAGVCILSMPEHQGRIPFFTGLDRIKFRKPIVPGDQVRMEIEVKKIKGVMGHVDARAFIDGKVAVEGILKFTVM